VDEVGDFGVETELEDELEIAREDVLEEMPKVDDDDDDDLVLTDLLLLICLVEVLLLNVAGLDKLRDEDVPPAGQFPSQKRYRLVLSASKLPSAFTSKSKHSNPLTA
jgi:hypothetical protein